MVRWPRSLSQISTCRNELEENLMLFFTGFSGASGILRDQKVKSEQSNAEMLSTCTTSKSLDTGVATPG